MTSLLVPAFELRQKQPAGATTPQDAARSKRSDEERESWLSCAACGTRIARSSDTMPATEPQVYANPAGCVFALVLLTQAINLRHWGEPTLQHTWFSGYAWVVATCAGCNAHVGWQFVACRPDLARAAFYGLLRDALRG